MENVCIAFELERTMEIPPEYKPAQLTLIIDVKMDFTHKARLVT
jgi:hypothetical protein